MYSEGKHVFAEQPDLPLRGYGELWHSGWDIPTRWAVDDKGQCWMNNAHGGHLSKVTPEQLIGTAEDEQTRNNLRGLVGLEKMQPCPHCHGAGWIKKS